MPLVPLTSLWLPILLSAVLVFVASSVIHMVLRYHRTDYQAVPSEDKVMEALQPFAIPPGDYIIPHAGSPEGMKSPEFQAKANAGPVMFASVFPNGIPGMGVQLAQWFAYCVLISIVAAYVGVRAVGPDAAYLEVFRFVGVTAFAAYALALVQNSIWYRRKWSTTLKSVFDGLIYAGLTAGMFGAMWP
jgi:hypothetical protein